MDNTRLFLWLSLFAMLWLNYDAWLRDRAPLQTPQAPATELVLPQDDVPEVASSTDDFEAAGSTADPPAATVAAPAMPISVRTDVLDLVIDTQGGDLVRADLLEYPVDKDQPNVVVRLLDFVPGNLWVFQTGLSTAGSREGPTHLAQWRAESSSYTLAPGQDELVVTLEWVGDDSLDVRKVYTFRRGSYEIGLDIVLENTGDAAWRGAPYARMQRLHQPPDRSFTSVDSYSFTGPVLYDGDSYQKLDVGDLRRQPVTQTVRGGWLAGIEHHFLAAAVPPPDASFQFDATAMDARYLVTAVGQAEQVTEGMQQTFALTLFVGPKLQEQLREAADGLVLTVDYGFLTILAQPLFWVLDQIHDIVGNWGWAIIIVTLLIKLVFYKLTATSGRSMAKMRKIAPRMKALQERYKDDRQGLSSAMMDLYRKEKINPAAGCLPILVQMPFFFAFYWVLIESVEMRQAPFMLWIDDLSSRDPYFVLPLLMGAAMFLQTRLNPAPPDPMQARIMQIMPIVFTVFFALFPSGLVLYWLTNTLVSIAQQWRINKLVAAEG